MSPVSTDWVPDLCAGQRTSVCSTGSEDTTPSPISRQLSASKPNASTKLFFFKVSPVTPESRHDIRPYFKKIKSLNKSCSLQNKTNYPDCTKGSLCPYSKGNAHCFERKTCLCAQKQYFWHETEKYMQTTLFYSWNLKICAIKTVFREILSSLLLMLIGQKLFQSAFVAHLSVLSFERWRERISLEWKLFWVNMFIGFKCKIIYYRTFF